MSLMWIIHKFFNTVLFPVSETCQKSNKFLCEFGVLEDQSNKLRKFQCDSFDKRFLW